MTHEIVGLAVKNLPDILSLLPVIPVLGKVVFKLSGDIRAIRDSQHAVVVPAGEKEAIVRSGASNARVRLTNQMTFSVDNYKPGH